MSALKTGTRLDLRGTHGPKRFRQFALKRDAVVTLRSLNERGLNISAAEPDAIEAHEVRHRFGWAWVLGRPNHHDGVTYLMVDDGAWIAGRMYDASPCYHAEPCRGGHPAPWEDLRLIPEPATFTHLTRTVHAANRAERYRTKSNGSCGRWVRDDDSIALCVCGWKTYTGTRAEAQTAARRHRDNPTTIDQT
jgi:hypothetical protein